MADCSPDPSRGRPTPAPRVAKPRVQQTGTSHLFVDLPAGRIETTLTGDGPGSWYWPIVCGICGQSPPSWSGRVGLRLAAEVMMLHHADAHLAGGEGPFGWFRKENR